MRGMTTPAALVAVLIAASIRWSCAYPNCAQHPSYNGGGGSKYNYHDDFEEEDVYDGNGTGMYYQEQYVEPWYPNNGVPMPRACTDPASNPRGYYNANLAPCRLQFHKISNDGDDSPYELSTACSDENLVGGSASAAAAGQKGSALYEYVINWPDECVGSFKRCYSVAKDERVFINEACRHGLVFPEGTTHVSLDCTDDRTMKQEATEKQNNNNNNNGSGPENDPYLRAQQQHVNDEIHEMEKVLFIIVALILVSCLGCIFAAYLLVVKPYQDTIKETRRTERDGLMMNNNTDDDEKGTTSKNGLSEVQLA